MLRLWIVRSVVCRRLFARRNGVDVAAEHMMQPRKRAREPTDWGGGENEGSEAANLVRCGRGSVLARSGRLCRTAYGPGAAPLPARSPRESGEDPASAGFRGPADLATRTLGLERQHLHLAAGKMGSARRPWDDVARWLLGKERQYLVLDSRALGISGGCSEAREAATSACPVIASACALLL